MRKKSKQNLSRLAGSGGSALRIGIRHCRLPEAAVKIRSCLFHAATGTRVKECEGSRVPLGTLSLFRTPVGRFIFTGSAIAFRSAGRTYPYSDWNSVQLALFSTQAAKCPLMLSSTCRTFEP